jgi:hypothetical protein
MAKPINIADSASRLDPRPSLASPKRLSRRDMTARSRVRVSAQV